MPGEQHNPTEAHRAAVRDLRAGGASTREIAREMHLNFRTIKKHYAVELGEVDAARKAISDAEQQELAVECFDAIREVVNGEESARDGRAAILIFTAKALLGWKETQVIEHGKRTARDLSDDELAGLIAERARARRGVAGKTEGAAKAA